MPLRQVLSHHAFLVRRVFAETLGFVALRVGSWPWIPSPLRGSLLRAGRHFLPRYTHSHLALGQWALKRGDTAIAVGSAKRAIATSMRIEEVPVLPSLIPGFLRALGFTAGKKEQLQKAAELGLRAASAAGESDLENVCHRIQEAFFTAEAIPGQVGEPHTKEIPDDPIATFRAHPEIASHLVRASETRRDAGDIHGAHRLLTEWRWTHPNDPAVWALSLELAQSLGNESDTHFSLERCLLIHPERAALAVKHLLDTPAKEDASLEPCINVKTKRALTPGESGELQITVPTGVRGHIIILAPYGLGVTPQARIQPIDDDGQTTFFVRAHRPHRLNQGQPWELTLIVATDQGFQVTPVPVSVTDPTPGQILAIITNDHELHDFRAWTEPAEADLLLVDKARMCEQIAEERGARWGHMVETSAIRLLGWLGDTHDDPAWKRTAKRYRDHLIECVERGHDLGLHIHAFYDPDGERFTHQYDPQNGELVAAPEHLFSQAGSRPFWHRAYPLVGDWDEPASKRGSLLRALARVEGLGRLGDPGFRVTLFRAGGYDIGKTRGEKRASLFAIRNAGILADSNVVKPRFYGQFARETLYLCTADDPGTSCERLADGWLPELVPEYNIEGDFLSNADILNRYVDERVRHFSPGGRIQPGVHIITSMSHTKFINFRRGLDSENLEKGYGDWSTIDAHLAHLNTRGVRVVRIRDAVDALVHDMTPEPVVVRGEEEIVAGEPTDALVEIRVALTVLGEGIPLDEGFPLLGVVHPPAWAAHSLQSIEIRCDGDLVTHRKTTGFSPLVFPLAGNGAYEMRFHVPMTQGISAEQTGPGEFLLRSAQPFRRAHVHVGDRLYKDVRFEQTAEGAKATVKTQ